MGGEYKAVGNVNDVQFADPTGQYAGALDAYTNAANRAAGALGPSGAYDPNAYMNQFLGQSAGLANMAQGATAPLGQSLSAIAAREARLGGEGALAAMPGMRNSGAGMAAFADAYASPFAQAAAQTQAAQLGLTGNLWNQAMGLNAASQEAAAAQYANMLAGRAGMAQGMGSMWQPSYEYQKGFGDYALDAAGLGVNLMTGGLGAGLMGMFMGGQNQNQNQNQNQAPSGGLFQSSNKMGRGNAGQSLPYSPMPYGGNPSYMGNPFQYTPAYQPYAAY